MNPAYSRIALRYVAGYLVLKGIIPEDLAKVIEQDKELAIAVGVGVAAIVEWIYAKAQKLGWRT